MAITIRPATVLDAAVFAVFFVSFVSFSVFSFETEAPDAAEFARRIEAIGHHFPWLVAANDDHIVGYAYACEHRTRRAYRWSVDAGIYLDAGSHRRGIGRRLYQALFTLLLRQGYYNAYAGITVPNAGSIGLHEALGFERVGIYRRVGFKLGAWRDVGWWELLLRESQAAPREPTPFRELPMDEVRAVLAEA